MKKIKIFTVQKNEEYLKDWLNYYGNIFDFENIYFIDNNSSNLYKNILQKYKNKYNINLYNINDFTKEKASKLTELMKSVKNDSDYLIQVDGDEFIGIIKKNKFIFNKQDILKEYENLNINYKYKYKIYTPHITKINYIDPLLEIEHFKYKNTRFTKVFYPAKHFVYTDEGGHSGKISINNDIKMECDFIMLHYNRTGINQLKKKLIKFANCSNNFKNKNRRPVLSHKYNMLKNNKLDKWYMRRTNKNIININNAIKITEFKDIILKLRNNIYI